MMNFLIGGVSGMIATSVIQPIDYVKVQIQVRSEMGNKNLSPFQIVRDITAKEGFTTLYKGLDSALLRQAVYTSTRLGIFYSIKDYIKKQNNGKDPNVVQNAVASLLAGAIGSFVGNPADLALVRMQSDSSLPMEERRNYKHVFDALLRTVKEEGVLTLWRGSFPTVCRAMAMNFSLLVPFEETKKIVKRMFPDFSENGNKIVACLVAGGCATVMSLPFDNVKTKLQKMKALPDGSLPYKGVVDCFVKSAKKEGASKLWVGINTYYFRIAPHALISLFLNDFFRHHYQSKKK
jgi:solute carrier family 25 oxoglutarate transporter 11